MTPKQRFMDACLNKEVDRPPVWMMRQAGRFLPEYRAIKEKSSTLEMMKTPELACEITLQPVGILGVDAAILYSDILMIPDAMAMGLHFAHGEGPKFKFALDSETALNRLNTKNISARLSFVFEAVKLCVKKLPKDFPLLGFAGAPFSVACYMISGGAGGSMKDFSGVKKFAWEQPEIFQNLMNILAEATIEYLVEQANAGVVAVQLFDTWAGLLSADDYRALAKPHTLKIFEALKKNNLPTIHYIKAGQHLLAEMSDLPSNAIGVDWRVDLKTVREKTGNKFAIQGNLDPDILLTTPDIIKVRLQKMVSEIPNPRQGYIINLGHGISQHTPVKNVQFFVEEAKRVLTMAP